MDRLDRLEAEADRRSAALATAASRVARRFTPLKIADDLLGRFGPATDVVRRVSLVSGHYPVATAALVLSAAFLAWQVLANGSLVSAHSRNAIAARRPARSHGRKLVPARHHYPNEGVQS